MSPQEYSNEMLLNKWLHKLELHIYENASWISHTNNDRMSMFLNDIKPINPLHTYILPNYPPASWKNQKKKIEKDKSRTGFIYVGALSLKTMYTKEMAEFIAANPEKYYWDIYSDTHEPDVIGYLNSFKTGNISFKGAVKYDDLPIILTQYNIGVILYKGHIPNFVYNAPNKLFEYYACGLNVWFPDKMKGVWPYKCGDKTPQIVPIDFENMAINPFNLAATDKTLPPGTKYYAEDVLEMIWEKINNNI
ncbi:MAG: hypothetical protein IT249_04510 [Chitinophagaceae bacterium]|nr:hypothetical protein [Chitinophagaceae bacterium]